MIEHPCPPFTSVRHAPIGAASYYLALNMGAVKILGGRNARPDVVVILEHDSAPVLRVFTSSELFRGFARAHFAEGDRVCPLATDPFGLAEAAAKLRARAGRRPPFLLGLRPSGTEGVFSDRYADKLDESLSTN